MANILGLATTVVVPHQPGFYAVMYREQKNITLLLDGNSNASSICMSATYAALLANNKSNNLPHQSTVRRELNMDSLLTLLTLLAAFMVIPVCCFLLQALFMLAGVKPQDMEKW